MNMPVLLLVKLALFCGGRFKMALMCLVVGMLFGIVGGQPHNPYFTHVDNKYNNDDLIAPATEGQDKDRPADPSGSLNALFLMQSPADHTDKQLQMDSQKSDDESESDPSVQLPGEILTPELPPGLTNNFPTDIFGQDNNEVVVHIVNGKYSQQSAGAESELSGTGIEKAGHEHVSGASVAASRMGKLTDGALSNNVLGLPGMFGWPGSTSSNRIRRNRDRNRHRKTRQQQAQPLVGTDRSHSPSLGGHRTKTEIIANQHFKFLSEASPAASQDYSHDSTKRKDLSAELQKAYAARAKGQLVNPGHGIRRLRRQKRGTSVPGRAENPADTFFYYRRPGGQDDMPMPIPMGRTEDSDDSPVRSVGIEDDEDKDSVPVGEPPVGSNPDEDRDDREDAPEEGQSEQPLPVQNSPSTTNAPAKTKEADSTNKKLSESSQFSSQIAENNTVNETIARQMFRSPMLVDYGSRVKPQDIIPPTETVVEDNEEELLPVAESKEEEAEPETLGDDATEDVDPEVEDKPPSVEPETEEGEEEPETEASETRIEVPIIPLRSNLNPPLPDQTLLSDDGDVPDAEGESEAKSEVGGEPEAEAHPELPTAGLAEGESEPEQEDGDDDDGQPTSVLINAYAEPEPEWDVAKKIWGPWWEVHIYGFGMAFAVLAIYSCVSVVRLWRRKNLLSQGYFIALNSIMLTMGFIRALYFLVDGYNSNKTFSIAGHYFLYSIGFPCLTSAFSILLLALVQTLKMQILSPKIQRTRVVIAIIAAHFLLSITTDVIVGYLSSAKIMLFVCQVTTVLWGLLLFIGYIYVFRKLYKSAKWRQNEMMRLSLAKFKLDGISPITKSPRLTLNMAVKITLATAMIGLILAGLQTYGMVGAFSVFSTKDPNPWTWWAFKTAMRATELAMCITLSYVATQPFRYNKGGKATDHPVSSSSCFSNFIYMAPCRRIFECDSVSLHDDDLSWKDLPISSRGESAQMDADGRHVITDESTPMTANGRAAHAAASNAVHPIVTEREGSTGSKRSSKIAARPASLLVSDNGFIRFREDGEMGESPVLLSTDDELENMGGDNMITRNPFYRDLIRRQERERAVGRATFVNPDGITLQDDFGVVEPLPVDTELVPPPRPAVYPVGKSSLNFRPGCSYPNTGTNTPGTPRSFCSTDLDYAASEISYRPPSSIHLRDSIENALNIPGFTLRTPDLLDSPLNAAYLRTRRGSLLGNRIGMRPMGTGSMSDLESLRHYGPGSRYGDSEDNSMDVVHQQERANSPDSMYSYTLSNLTRAPLVRSYSDSIGKASQPEMSAPNSPERRGFYPTPRKDRLRATMMMHHVPQNANQFQNLLKNINDMCNVYNKLSPDDREGDE